MTQPAVFIDKDGTLIRDGASGLDPERIGLAPGAGPALRRLQDSGFVLIVIASRTEVGQGRLHARALERLRGRVEALLSPYGVVLAGFYLCPHAAAAAVEPDGTCRQPGSGLLQRAALEHRVDLARSWMVGNILNDVEAGRRAGCRTALIDSGNETEWQLSRWRLPDLVAGNLDTAARLIAQVERQGEAARAHSLH
jgi:D-glycero-D-manno-heptose 1,7-bisphosphate phosphatase